MKYLVFTIIGCAMCAVAQTAAMAASRTLHPFKVCLLRFGLAAPLCYIVSVADTRTLLPPVTPRQFYLTAIVSLISWCFGAAIFFYAMKRGGQYRVGPVSNSLGIWAALLSIFFLHEKFFPALIPVLILLAVGIYFMAPASQESDRWPLAIPAGVLVSGMWASGIVLTKVVIHGMPYATFVCLKMCVATIFFAVIYPFVGTKLTKESFLLGLLSASSLVVGDIMLMVGVDGLPASVFSPLFAMIIPFTFLFSIVWLKEKPMKRNWVGMILIFAAAAVCGYYGAR